MYALNTGVQGVMPLAAEAGLADPLRTVTAVSTLIAALADQGLSLHISSDFAELARTVARGRRGL